MEAHVAAGQTALAAARLALPPEACFFTDDLAHNIEAARGVGFTGHVFEGVDGLVAALAAARAKTAEPLGA